MENKPPKEYMNNNNYNSKSFSSNNHKKIPHPKSKNLKYYPITTNNSYQGEHIIYLAAEDDEKNKLIKNIKKKNIKKRNKNNKFLAFQRSIEMEFPKINIISTSKNSCDNENSNSKHQIKRSYSVENYTNVTNKSFDILGLNLKLLENSKIMDINFINGIKDSKRKNNLLNALNKYNRYKSWGNINEKNNNIIILNEGKNENNLQKIEKKFDMKNGCNIIEEDENENSENDTINIKKNNKDYINKKNTNSKEKDIKNNSINININDNLKMDNSSKEKNCQPISNQISKKIKISNQNISIYVGDKFKKVLKPINNNKVISKEINKTGNEITNKIYQEKQINDKENKKYIKKSIQNEINKIFKINNVDQSKKLKININNNINNNIKINNNININNNNLKNISPKITKKILVRKIMREEKYIIDDKGNKKVIEINQSILDDKDNNKNNTKKIMIKEGRYHRNSPRIKLINVNNSNRMINGYYRNIKSPNNNHFIKSKTSCNSNKKNNNSLRNNRIIINSPFIYNNNIYSNSNLIYFKKNYINIFNNSKYRNRNNKILTETRTSPNKNLSNYKISFINDNNNINNNHAFHEIKKLSKKNNDKVAKTIYHDYSNEGKKIILNNNFENILVISENKNRNRTKIINRSYSNSYFQIPNNIKNEIGKNLKKNGIKYRNKNYEN